MNTNEIREEMVQNLNADKVRDILAVVEEEDEKMVSEKG